MNTLRTSLILLILLSLLAACTTAPAEAPVEPTAEPVRTEPPATETDSLTANPWQWVAFTSPVEQFTIEDPQNYLLTFNQDGTVSIQADCNNASGTYTTDGSSLTIVVGPMTRAACPEGSRGNDFVNYLNFTGVYFFKDGHLFIDLMADGGTLEFAPQGESLTRTPSLTETPWQWVAFTNPMQQFTVENSQNYLLTFKDDGTVIIAADCNTVLGTYTTDGSSIKIELGPSTLMACPEGSQGDAFIQYLSFAAIYFFQGTHLYIDLFADGGTMEFAPAGPDAKSDAPHDLPQSLIDSLANGTYTGIFPDQPVTLKDGLYEYNDGSSAKPFVRLYDSAIATGDLNGDGVLDAVVLLEDNSAGTGRFVFAVAVLDAQGSATSTDALMIGDRIQVKSLSIDGGQITADLVAQGEGDPACCASWNVRKQFGLDNNRLVEKSSEELSKVSLADLDGSSWRLVDLNSLVGEPPLPETETTLLFDGEQISGSAGCNSYSAGIQSKPDAPQSLTVGEIATTMMACDESVMTQEATYLDRLSKVVGWGYIAGRLALVYETDGGFGNLVFESNPGN